MKPALAAVVAAVLSATLSAQTSAPIQLPYTQFTLPYWVNVPSNALELALFLESDRMGYLLDSMSPALVDARREVAKRELDLGTIHGLALDDIFAR